MSFIKIHLKLEKANFISFEFSPIQEESCDYERFHELMKRVGEPSNWNKRKIFYDPECIKRLKALFNKPASRLWLFKKDQEDIGFCQVAGVEDLRGLFNRVSGIAEIYKIGLFPEFTGKGLGRGYVSCVARELFKTHETIYLNTRNSNAVNAVPFYKRLGFEVIKTEILPDDLVP